MQDWDQSSSFFLGMFAAKYQRMRLYNGKPRGLLVTNHLSKVNYKAFNIVAKFLAYPIFYENNFESGRRKYNAIPY